MSHKKSFIFLPRTSQPHGVCVCLIGTRLGLLVNFVDTAAETTNFPRHFSCPGWRNWAVCLLASHQKAKGPQWEGMEAFILFPEMKGEFKKQTLSEAETKS